jgi:hypothetical protein
VFGTGLAHLPRDSLSREALMELTVVLMIGLLVGTFCVKANGAGTEPSQPAGRGESEVRRRPLRASRGGERERHTLSRARVREKANHLRRIEHLEDALRRARESGDVEMERLTERMIRAEHARHAEKSRRLGPP